MSTITGLTHDDLLRACADVTGDVSLPGLNAPALIHRDAWGIPHIRAESESDAFFAQGFATSQDRFWQMEQDRLRGLGRWAEVVGPEGVEQDKFMRRCLLERSARDDYWASSPETRAMFDAYAAGVNAYIDSADPLPIEFQITGATPEPWQPWDGLVVYKVRHLPMGIFESKVLRARLVRALGPEKTAQVFPGYEPGQLLILPPGARHEGSLQRGLEELTAAATAVNELHESDLGSNSWVISGGRTASGKPILSGDSHRALNTPNVYYQNHVACPGLDVVGLSFPGLPGFPHFGHNPWVAWCVTHTWADYQDLYIERFHPDMPEYYLFREEWRRAEVRHETIRVRGAEDVPLTSWNTHHGPIISGDAASGTGLALRYTATDEPSAWPDTLRGMLVARNAGELTESMREWVDPCNNLVFADVLGNTGYLVRGEIPLRDRLNGWLPVPGWTGRQEWQGRIPFDEMPRSSNPDTGYIATANNKPVDDSYPYHIGVDFSPGYRVELISRAIDSMERPTAADMAEIHRQRRSIPADALLELLRNVDFEDEAPAWAKDLLLGWDRNMDAGSVAPTVYSAARDRLLEGLLRHNLGEVLANLALNPAGRGAGVFLTRFKSLMATAMEKGDAGLLPPGCTWTDLAGQSLREAMVFLSDRLGDDRSEWRWGRVHRARPVHPLSSAFPDWAFLLDPPAIAMSGDGETPLAGAYAPADFATVGGLSVARYSYDLSDWNNCLWAIPLGCSGHPGSSHYADQSEPWRKVEMVPMLYDWDAIAAQAETTQRLQPA